MGEKRKIFLGRYCHAVDRARALNLHRSQWLHLDDDFWPDKLMGLKAKDFDLEIVGPPPAWLERVWALRSRGFEV